MSLCFAEGRRSGGAEKEDTGTRGRGENLTNYQNSPRRRVSPFGTLRITPFRYGHLKGTNCECLISEGSWFERGSQGVDLEPRPLGNLEPLGAPRNSVPVLKSPAPQPL
ncbi:MAG: hypothetical protein BRC55_07895 [Cyanobacteria bacterium SW_8_48_13]|nr:MAG: hypothetical protein BRC55_07895 [Cyanobacteria bacterium SW_8_48_13]